MFFFEGQARWSGPWVSPNHLGACLAMLLPFLWSWKMLCSHRLAVFALWIAEGLAYWTLCKTYSRGSLVALAAAATVFIGAELARQDWPARRFFLQWLYRGLLVAACCFLTQFDDRVSLSYLAGDAAVVHRLDIWRGAMAMIPASPLFGWGRDLGAVHYMNWYHSLSAGFAVNNLVSGVLQLAVEYGLFAFVLVMGLVFWVVIAPLAPTARPQTLIRTAVQRSCGAAVAAFTAGNLFSTLTPATSLDVFCVLAVSVAVVLTRMGRRTLLATGAVALLISSALAVGLWVAGRNLNAKLPIAVRHLSNGDVLLAWPHHQPDRLLYVVPDGEVLGGYPGQAIRQIFRNLSEGTGIVVCTDPRNFGTAPYRELLVCGRATAAVGPAEQRHVLLLHPIADSAIRLPLNIKSILPGIDQLGQNTYWARRTAPIFYSPGVGLDARPVLARIAALVDHEILAN